MKNRREFLKTLTVIGGGIAMANSPIDMSANTIAKFGVISPVSLPQDDYKALVCIFLHGGNDSVNMLVPYDEEGYNDYKSIRPSVAHDKKDLHPINTHNQAFALHPNMKGIRDLYDQKKVAFIANAGTLIEPVVKGETTRFPPHLFSHSSQRKQWQTCRPYDFIQRGWAGRLADAMPLPVDAKIPYNLSLNGTNTWQKGNDTMPFRFVASGAMKFNNLNEGSSHRDTFKELIDDAHGNPFTRAYAKIQETTLERSEMFDSILNSMSLDTQFSNDSLEQKLKVVAQIIKAQDMIGLPRQTFYIAHGGFDTHNAQHARQNPRLESLNNALVSFNEALEEIGMQDAVTTFVGSDFGRTVTSNSDGTDHGWGGHYFVMGGAVNGGEIYGEMPSLKPNSPDIVRNGRLEPKISVEQYMATLCKWYGLTDESLYELFPHLKNFEQIDLGFMKA